MIGIIAEFLGFVKGLQGRYFFCTAGGFVV